MRVSGVILVLAWNPVADSKSATSISY